MGKLIESAVAFAPFIIYIKKWNGYRAPPLITLLPNCSIRCPDFCFVRTVLRCGVPCSTPHVDGGGGRPLHVLRSMLWCPFCWRRPDDRRRSCHPSLQLAADLVLRDMTDGGAVPSRCNRRRPRSPMKATPGSDGPSLSSLSSSPARCHSCRPVRVLLVDSESRPVHDVMHQLSCWWLVGTPHGNAAGLAIGWRPQRQSCKPRTKLQKKATYTDMKAIVFIVTATVVAAEYNLLQAVRYCVALAMFGRGDMVPGRRGDPSGLVRLLVRPDAWRSCCWSSSPSLPCCRRPWSRNTGSPSCSGWGSVPSTTSYVGRLAPAWPASLPTTSSGYTTTKANIV